jgi:hypothetical protein
MMRKTRRLNLPSSLTERMKRARDLDWACMIVRSKMRNDCGCTGWMVCSTGVLVGGDSLLAVGEMWPGKGTEIEALEE